MTALIEQQSRTLAERSGRGVKVVAVTARSKAKKRSVDMRGIEWAKSPQALAEDPDIDCFVELMGGSGDPVRRAAAGAHRPRSPARPASRLREPARASSPVLAGRAA